LPEEEGEPEGMDLEEEAIVDEPREEAAPEEDAAPKQEVSEVEDAPEEEAPEETEEEPVMANGGTAVVDLNVPDPMRRYMVAMQRTLPDSEMYSEDEADSFTENEEDEETVRAQEIERLALEPEELRFIQETFNVHSIEEILETLKFKEEELVRIKSDFSIKMRNTLALQRIRFEVHHRRRLPQEDGGRAP
jgi:hypothetical protein